MSQDPPILLADDSEEDVLLIRRAFEKAGINNPLHIVRDGDEAIAYLGGHGKYSDRKVHPFPALLLLDLAMPGTDGFEVLRWVRANHAMEALRILVLTSSDRIWDVNQAYRLGANSFMVKPVEFQDLVMLSKSLHDYWLIKTKAPEISAPSLPAPPSKAGQPRLPGT
jgi:CheY-like chemotaxis protein